MSGAAIAGRGVYAALEDFASPPARAGGPGVTPPGAVPDRQPRGDPRQRHDGCHPADLQRRVHGEARPRAERGTRRALVAAQKRLEAALARVESPYPSTAAGLTIVVAWGLPYFRSSCPAPWETKAPRDLLLPLENGQRPFAVLDAIRFPSDPAEVALEDNHVAFKIRSDSPHDPAVGGEGSCSPTRRARPMSATCCS